MPDFTPIAAGFARCRCTALNRLVHEAAIDVRLALAGAAGRADKCLVTLTPIQGVCGWNLET